MPLFLDDEQTMLKDTARGFLKEAAPVSHMRRLRDQTAPHGFCSDLWGQFAEMGFTGMTVPEAAGGLGLGAVEAGVLMEEIGRNLTPSPFMTSSIAAISALKLASAELQARYLPALAEGSMIATLAIEEGRHHRPEQTALKAEKQGGTYRLTGQKQMVIYGDRADLILVLARTSGAPGDQTGLSFFALPASADGLSVTTERLADASLAGFLNLDGVTVAADQVIGDLDAGWQVLTPVLAQCRAATAAELIGLASAAFDLTLGYMKERVQFGRLIGEFQALQHRAAHIYSELEVAYAATLKAQQLLDSGDASAPGMALIAKAQAGLASSLAVQESLQLHGGIGMTDEHDIGLFMKRQRVLSALFGDADRLADQLATSNGY